jgi:hypothetical protein
VTKIKEQIRAACLGVAAAVEQLQTDSGVKDKISVHWIGLLIDKAREIQKQRIFNHETRDPRLGDAKIVGDAWKAIKQGLMEMIQEELYTWVIMQPPERYEKLDQETRNYSLCACSSLLI